MRSRAEAEEDLDCEGDNGVGDGEICCDFAVDLVFKRFNCGKQDMRDDVCQIGHSEGFSAVFSSMLEGKDGYPRPHGLNHANGKTPINTENPVITPTPAAGPCSFGLSTARAAMVPQSAADTTTRRQWMMSSIDSLRESL